MNLLKKMVFWMKDEAELIEDGDPRIGRQVILLPESQRRGEVIVGSLVAIEKYRNGDEVWTAETDSGARCHMASFLYCLVPEQEM